MRRFISGIMIFTMLFSALALPPVSANATSDEPENADIQPLADTAEEETPDQEDETIPEGFPKNGYVTGNGVNVRAGAGTSYDVVYKLNKNDPVTIQRQESVGDMDWGQLADGNWISLNYVAFEEPVAMTSSQAFVDILKKREGFSATPYWDVSHYSIGYGTSVPSSKVDYYKKNPITEAEGEAMMREHLLEFEEAVLKFAKKYSLTFTQSQFDGIVSFCYNCGDAWLSETTGYMNRAVREGWVGSDFVYAMCLWSRAGAEYILMNRRMYEANMYLNGIYQSPYDYEAGTFRYVFLEAGQGTVRYIVHGYDYTDPKPVHYQITKFPTGVDKNGDPFTYEFAGWYTAPENGVLVEVLDDKIPNATVLHAMWKDPEGNIVYLEKGTPCNNVQVKVTNVDSTVNVRSGPGTYYPKVGTLKKNTVVTLLRVYDDGKTAWGQYEGGWFSLQYSNYDGSLEETEGFPQYGVVNTDGVNVRNGAGTDNASLYKLNEGDSVTILQKTTVDGMVWGQLEDGNWISMTYVTITEAPVEQEPEPGPEPEVMTASQSLLDTLKQRVGYSSRPYWNTSHWSVGYGTEISESEAEYYESNPISMEKASELLLSDLAEIEAILLSFAGAKGLEFTQNQFDALISFSYLCGVEWLSDADCSMYLAVTEGWKGSDFLYAISLWSNVGAEYSSVHSRVLEADIYLNGNYSLKYDFTNGSFRYVFLEAGQGAVNYLINSFDIEDPEPVRGEIVLVPVGTDKNGNPFSYEFAGWYTAPENGKLVETLDALIPNASVPYAMWEDPDGNLIHLAKGTPCEDIKVTIVNVEAYVNVRTGPGTYYPVANELELDSKVTLEAVYDDGEILWGYFSDGWIDLAHTNFDEVQDSLKPFPRSGTVNATSVNVRSGPGTSNPTQYKLNKDAPVTIYQRKYADAEYWGKLEDGNWICLKYVTYTSDVPDPEPEPEPEPEPGPEPQPSSADMDGNGAIDKDDAIYLLRHVVYPEQYPLSVNGDVNGSGMLDKDDAIYLLRHVVYPEQYPLNYGE